MKRAHCVSLCTHTVQRCRRLKGMSEAVLVSHCCCNKSPRTQWLKTSQTYYYCRVSTVRHRSCSANETVSAAVASPQEALGKLFSWFVFLSTYGLPPSFVYDYFLIRKPSSSGWGLCEEGFFSFFLFFPPASIFYVWSQAIALDTHKQFVIITPSQSPY